MDREDEEARSRGMFEDEVRALLSAMRLYQPTAEYSDLNPLKYQTPPDTVVDGERLVDVVPPIVAGIPVIVGGQRYLIALMKG